MATYLPTYQAHSRVCSSCTALVRRNIFGGPDSTTLNGVETALNNDTTGKNQTTWSNEIVKYETEKEDKAKGVVLKVKATKKKAKALEANNHCNILNLGVWWPKDQWNASYPDHPCKKEELEKCVGHKGLGVIRDKRYGEPPGTVTLNNQNTRSTVKTTDLGTSFSDMGDAELDAQVAWINNASMPAAPTKKASADPNGVAAFKMSFTKNAKSEVSCSDFIGSTNYQYAHLAHGLSIQLGCTSFLGVCGCANGAHKLSEYKNTTCTSEL